MIRLLLRTLVYFASAAVGLLVAAAVLDDFSLGAEGFGLVVVVFALIQTIISPFLARVAAKSASALLGGIGLLSTFVALATASVVGDALTIRGVGTWIAATVIVWLATALATLLLPLVVLRKARGSGDQSRDGSRDGSRGGRLPS